ncbi:MAG: TrkA C-terminal domain-containing protein, partial [Akkermansiaceae bacterium]
LLVKLGSNALQLTGVSPSIARFQAASAFFGVGFTTSEAELVVKHPVRRKIILHLIIAGNIGLTSALATLLVTLVGSNERGMGITMAWLGVTALGIFALGVFFNLKVISEPLDRFMRKTLEKAGLNRVVDFDYLLNLRDGYCVFDGEIHKSHPWVGSELWELRPADQGVIVLGIYRTGGEFIGAPKKDTLIKEGDLLMIYGRDEDVTRIFGISNPGDEED